MKKFKTKQFTLILHITVRLDPLLIKRIQRKLLMAVDVHWVCFLYTNTAEFEFIFCLNHYHRKKNCLILVSEVEMALD